MVLYVYKYFVHLPINNLSFVPPTLHLRVPPPGADGIVLLDPAREKMAARIRWHNSCKHVAAVSTGCQVLKNSLLHTHKNNIRCMVRLYTVR